MVPAAAVAVLGMPALGLVVLLAVLVLAVVCWVIASQNRTNRLSQILLALRGTPAAQTPAVVSPTKTSAVRRSLRLIAGRKKQRG